MRLLGIQRVFLKEFRTGINLRNPKETLMDPVRKGAVLSLFLNPDLMLLHQESEFTKDLRIKYLSGDR